MNQNGHEPSSQAPEAAKAPPKRFNKKYTRLSVDIRSKVLSKKAVNAKITPAPLTRSAMVI